MLSSFDQTQSGARNTCRRDARHTAMVNWTFSQKARAAIDTVAQNRRSAAGGSSCLVVCCAKDRDGWNAKSGSDVHRPRIIGEKHFTGGGELDKLSERRQAGEIHTAFSERFDALAHRLADSEFFLRAEDSDRRAAFCRDLKRSLSEALREPAFRAAIRCSWTDADDRAMKRSSGKSFPSLDRRIRRTAQTNDCVARIIADDPGAAQEFEIVKTLMRRNLTGIRLRNGPGQENSAAVTGVADAFRNASKPHKDSGFESIRQEHSAIEAARPQFARELPFLNESPPAARRVVRNELVAKGFAAIQTSDPRPRQNGDVSVRMARAQLLEGGNRHHRVAHPVGCSD